MSLPIEALEAELLGLPSVERARLLDRVVASLDADKSRDQAWDRLAAERDLGNAARFYRREAGRAVAERFLDEFERVASLLEGNPELGTVTGGKRRWFPLPISAANELFETPQ